MKDRFAIKRFAVTVCVLLGLYIAILGLSALLTPPIFRLCQSLHGLPHVDFRRVFDRLRFVGLFLALPLLWKQAGLIGFKSLGWREWQSGILWMFIGALSVLILGFFFAPQVHAFQPVGVSSIMTWVLQGFAAAIGVSLLEEIIFRGILQRFVIKKTNVWAGIFLTAAIFAWLHGRPAAPVLHTYNWAESFSLALNYLTMPPVNLSLMAVLNLFLLGLALGILYDHSRSLWWPMGLHAGIVAAAVPMLKILSHADKTFSLMFVLSSPLVTAVFFILAAVAVWVRQARPRA